MPTFTKASLRTALGFTLDSELAGFFGISASAISQWGEDEPIPALRQLWVEARRPDLCGAAPTASVDEVGACPSVQ